MSIILKWLQIIGLLLVGIGLFHGIFDNNPTDGMWMELWYLLAGAGIFYTCTMIQKYRK